MRLKMVIFLVFTLSHLNDSHQWFSEIFQLDCIRRLLSVLKKWITEIIDFTRFSANDGGKIIFLSLTRIIYLER